MRSAVDIAYTAPKTVGRFLGSNKRVRAIVGPIGSGKSSGCNLELPKRARTQAPWQGKRFTRFAVVRNTYRELEDTTRKTFEQWVPEELGGWREKDFAFEMEFEDVVSEVLFRALDKPRDVKKLLSLELTGCYFNELREIAQPVFNGMRGRVGRYPSMAKGGPTWYGVWGDSNPWASTSWQYALFNEKRPEGFGLFEQPDGLGVDAENVNNLVPGYYADLCLGMDQAWVDEYVRAKYPRADRGSVYGHLIADLKARGGAGDFEHGNDGCFLAVDLGYSDAFAMWWFRFGPNRGIDIVDHYEASGRTLAHYFDVIDQRGWGLRKIFLPHDARAKTLQTGQSTQERFVARYPGTAVIGPELSPEDGIQAARWVLEQPTTRIHSRCQSVTGPEDLDGIAALAAYRYKYDEDKEVFSKTPLHDWASHTADAFRYLACAVRFSEEMSRPPPPPPTPEPAGPPAYSFPALSSIKSPGRGRL